MRYSIQIRTGSRPARRLDVLPAATISYDIGPQEEPDRVRLRLGYGKTLSRPDFREYSCNV